MAVEEEEEEEGKGGEEEEHEESGGSWSRKTQFSISCMPLTFFPILCPVRFPCDTTLSLSFGSLLEIFPRSNNQ